MADVTIRYGDRLPALARQFLTDGAATDLTGASVVFNLWNAETGAQVITSGSVTVTTAATGHVEYAWTASDATLPAGVYLGSFTATFSASRKLTAPNAGMIVVEIVATTGAEFSYTGNPSARPVDAVRYLAGDVDSTNPQATDGEIAFLLVEWNNDPYLAAAAVCDAAAGRYTAKGDQSKSVGDLSITLSYGAQADTFRSRAASLRAQAARRYPPAPTYSADAVGSFVFTLGMDDNV